MNDWETFEKSFWTGANIFNQLKNLVLPSLKNTKYHMYILQ